MELSSRSKAALQIFAGVVAVVLVYLFSLWLLNKESLVVNPNTIRPPALSTTILDGYADATNLASTSWSTINPNAFNFVSLPRSYNRKGGAQFSYSLWIQLRDTSAPNVAGKTLFMRGDRTRYRWRTAQFDPSTNSTTALQTYEDVMIKCPRVRFGKSFDELVVEFNTLADPSSSVTITPDVEATPIGDGTGYKPSSADYDPSLRRNAVQLMQNRWALLTFVFEDSIAINDFEDGILVRFYLNDLLYKSLSSRSTLKQNAGDFVMTPLIGADETPIAGATLGNMAYYNYALGMPEVREIYQRGPPTKPAALQIGGLGEPLYLSEYNKLDVYNN
jgi:hypothetical protein